jgi:hypothetical protein
LPMLCAVPPCTWPSTIMGLMIVPQSCAMVYRNSLTPLVVCSRSALSLRPARRGERRVDVALAGC